MTAGMHQQTQKRTGRGSRAKVNKWVHHTCEIHGECSRVLPNEAVNLNGTPHISPGRFPVPRKNRMNACFGCPEHQIQFVPNATRPCDSAWTA